MFPMTVTVHNQAQLAAVLAAMGAPLAAAAVPSISELSADLQARVASQKTTTEAAAEQVEKPASATKRTSAATTAESARGQRTASAGAETDAPEKTAAESNPTAASVEGDAQASTAAEPLTYEQVAAAITAMVKKDRQKAVDTLAKFGVKKGPELKPEQYAEFMAALEG